MPEKTIWADDGRVSIIDQTRLPGDFHKMEVKTVGEMWEAIKSLRVRGAPAIGIAAAFGVWIAVKHLRAEDSLPLDQAIENACSYLATARPTAVNLFWALDRVRKLAKANTDLPHNKLQRLVLAEAEAMLAEDYEICTAIGRHGAGLLEDGHRILTHCNAGGLATAGYGTALAPVYYAVEKLGKHLEVFADETRPLLQGARLTSWELVRASIPVTLICDNMAAVVLRNGWVNAVIVGTDRVARNGDFANKIGTYGLAVLAREHNVPLYVAAPLSSIDISLSSGAEIPIEERNADEITSLHGLKIAPEGVKVFNPAFDVTPHRLVTAFITEKGIVRPSYEKNLTALFD
ncbi:MAG: S-methyl-5-thioribose-1-phosphate isomerase [Candidatus Sumerlaeaceae bacterium]|nr:S-methyl-5-thioribose-1-phosphate isomerase [Candidatus Sumerlaeaceae bacterium]